MLLLDVLELLNLRPNLFGLIDGLYHHLLNTATPSGHHVLPMGPNFLLAPAFESLFPEVSSNLRVIFMPNLSFHLIGITRGIFRAQPLSSDRDGEEEQDLEQPALRFWQNKSLLAIISEGSLPVDLPICRSEPVALSGQGAQLPAMPDLGPKATALAMEPILPSHQSRENKFTAPPNF